MLPLHAPEAVQAVALTEIQFRVAPAPLVMALGPTLNVTVGAAALTETIADWLALPPRPEHVRV